MAIEQNNKAPNDIWLFIQFCRVRSEYNTHNFALIFIYLTPPCDYELPLESFIKVIPSGFNYPLDNLI